MLLTHFCGLFFLLHFVATEVVCEKSIDQFICNKWLGELPVLEWDMATKGHFRGSCHQSALRLLWTRYRIWYRSIYNLYTWKLNHRQTIWDKRWSSIGNVFGNTFRTWGALWELDENGLGTDKKQKNPFLPVPLLTPQKNLKGKH